MEMRTENERIADAILPMWPWIQCQLFGPTIGKLVALSMCRPTPKIVEIAVDAFGNVEPDFARALQSSSFRRKFRRAFKKEMLSSLKVEAKEPGRKLLRSFLKELEEGLRSRGYQWDDTRIPKIADQEAEYTARTVQLINELYQRPEALAKVFPPNKTLGGIRARHTFPFLDGKKENYYAHLVSLIYEICCQPDEMKLSRGHVSDLMGGLVKKLPPEMSRLVNELKSLQADEREVWLSGLLEDGARRRRLVNEFIEAVSAGDKILPILLIIMRYFFIETMPNVPSDEASSHKRLPLDDKVVEHIADGQVYTGAHRYTPNGREPVYNSPTPEGHLDDSERLAIFAKRAGINISDLTAKEQQGLLELMNALDTGYDFSSKKGVSIKAYYGDRADSEKTRRSKLFKKIKRLKNSPTD